MAIWFRNFVLDDLKKREANTMSEHLGMEFTEIGENYIEMTMPVDHRTKQPWGLMNGGASAALAETVGSTAGNLTLDLDKEMVVGVELNANHIRACRSGFVTARATPLHIGRVTQVWEIKITQRKHLVCVSRLTLAVVKRRKLGN